MEVSITPNKIEKIPDIFRILLNDPIENMKSEIQKAMLFNYIKSKYKVPAYDEFEACIPLCASQVDKVELVNDLLQGKRQVNFYNPD